MSSLIFILHEEGNKDVNGRTVSSSVDIVKQHTFQFGPSNVYNSDQRVFELQMHSGRTLPVQGMKTVQTFI